MDGEFRVFFQELINAFTFMPTGSIDPKMDTFFHEHIPNLGESHQESICIALRASNHTMTARQRINPTEDIQTFLVLTARQNNRLVVFSLLRPYPSQLRMKTKTGLVLKHNSLVIGAVQNDLEFFLSRLGMLAPLSWLPVHIYRLVVSMKIPTHEGESGHDALVLLPDDTALDTQQRRLHPTGLWPIQNPSVTFQALSLNLFCNFDLIGMAFLDAPYPPPSPYLHYWHDEPISQRSTGTNQTSPLPLWFSIPIESTTTQQSEYLPRHLELTPPSPTASLVLLAGLLFLMHAYITSRIMITSI
jgi:hypothetical protein